MCPWKIFMHENKIVWPLLLSKITFSIIFILVTMGRSSFIRVITNEDDLHDSIRCIIEHNNAGHEKYGNYTDEEFERIDPERAQRSKFMKGMMNIPGVVMMHVGCQEKWNRGEDIDTTGILVRFQGKIWLEVCNGGGGACTNYLLATRTLSRHELDRHRGKA